MKIGLLCQIFHRKGGDISDIMLIFATSLMIPLLMFLLHQGICLLNRENTRNVLIDNKINHWKARGGFLYLTRGA